MPTSTRDDVYYAVMAVIAGGKVTDVGANLIDPLGYDEDRLTLDLNKIAIRLRELDYEIEMGFPDAKATIDGTVTELISYIDGKL